VRPEIRVIGVQTNDSDAMVRSVKAGKRVQLNDVGLFSDGTAVKMVGQETFRLARALVDDYVVVDTDAVCAAIKDVFQDTLVRAWHAKDRFDEGRALFAAELTPDQVEANMAYIRALLTQQNRWNTIKTGK